MEFQLDNGSIYVMYREWFSANGVWYVTWQDSGEGRWSQNLAMRDVQKSFEQAAS
jgi:hypothetical protein